MNALHPLSPATLARAPRFLTGITTSGAPHLGNFVGSIRPSVAASQGAGVESFYFLADYHALIKCDDPVRIQRSTLEIAASWLAAGLDPERVVFYRQSDVPEIPELAWLLTCVTGKGILNRAHAYKASVDKNTAAGSDADADITAGLFMYPVLMAADILLFKAHQVPVGRDQIQHIEMARDIALRFNHLYGDHLVLPEALVEESVATLPGLDGRKMSKSYDNTIPMFAPASQLRKSIAAIVTDSRMPGEPKDTEGSALFQIFRAFASPAETDAFRAAFDDGIGWGEAKTTVYQRIERDIAPLRERYEALMANPGHIEDILKAGAHKARQVAQPFMRDLREAVGLRALTSMSGEQAKPGNTKEATAAFKQYKETDGLFYFKLLSSSGQTLLQSAGFALPQEAAAAVDMLKSKGTAALTLLEGQLHLVPGATQQALVDAIG
jgi:tryptophanyl-tRNA synthetase